MRPQELLRAAIMAFLLFGSLYAITVFPAFPYLLFIIVAFGILLWKHEAIMGLLAKLRTKLTRKKPAPPSPKEIPEGLEVPPPLPKKEELKPTMETIHRLLDLAQEQGRIIQNQNAVIAELRGELDRLKEELGKLEKEKETIGMWLGTKDMKSLSEKLATIAFASYLQGVPVLNRKGEKLGTLVGIVPDPMTGNLCCLVQDAYGMVRVAGSGRTWADPTYFPLVDPKSWQGLMEEIRKVQGSLQMSPGTMIQTIQNLTDHAIILSEWAEGAPQYVDAFAMLPERMTNGGSHERPVRQVVVTDYEYAKAFEEQRRMIEDLKKERNQLYMILDDKEREIDRLKGLLSATLLQLSTMKAGGGVDAQVLLLKALKTESERGDTYMKMLQAQEEAKSEAERLADILGSAKAVESKELAGSTTLDIAENTINRVKALLSGIESPDMVLAKALAKRLAKASEEKPKKEEGG